MDKERKNQKLQLKKASSDIISAERNDDLPLRLEKYNTAVDLACKFGNREEALFLVGRAEDYALKGKLSEALVDLKKAAVVEPEWVLVHEIESSICKKLGDEKGNREAEARARYGAAPDEIFTHITPVFGYERLRYLWLNRYESFGPVTRAAYFLKLFALLEPFRPYFWYCNEIIVILLLKIAILRVTAAVFKNLRNPASVFKLFRRIHRRLRRQLRRRRWFNQ